MLAGVLSLAAIIAMSLWLTFRVQSYADDAVRARRISGQAAEVLSLVTDAETGQRGFLLVDEPKYLAPYRGRVRRLAEAANALALLAEATPGFHGAAERTSTLIRSKMEELAETIALVKDGRLADAINVVRTDRGKDAMDAIRQVVGSIVADADMQVSTLLEQGKKAATALFWVNTISSVLVALVALAAGWIVARYASELIEARRAVIAANTSLETCVAERTIDLARANEEIQRLAYIVSHDLRAPLVNVVGFTAELEASAHVLQRFISQTAVRRGGRRTRRGGSHGRVRRPAGSARFHSRVDDEDGPIDQRHPEALARGATRASSGADRSQGDVRCHCRKRAASAGASQRNDHDRLEDAHGFFRPPCAGASIRKPDRQRDQIFQSGLGPARSMFARRSMPRSRRSTSPTTAGELRRRTTSASSSCFAAPERRTFPAKA